MRCLITAAVLPVRRVTMPRSPVRRTVCRVPRATLLTPLARPPASPALPAHTLIPLVRVASPARPVISQSLKRHQAVRSAGWEPFPKYMGRQAVRTVPVVIIPIRVVRRVCPVVRVTFQ